MRVRKFLISAAALSILLGILLVNGNAQSALLRAIEFRLGSHAITCTMQAGNGSPEGVVRGSVCDTFYRKNGNTGNILYVKNSGTNTTTGWGAVAADSTYPSFTTGANDDEFDNNSFTGWTAVNSGTHNPTITETNGIASFLLPGSDAASELHAYMKAPTITTNDWIEVAYRQGGLSQNYDTFCLEFADGVAYNSGTQVGFCLPRELNTFSYYTQTGYNSSTNINTYNATNHYPGTTFMRFKYLGSNSWQGYTSSDGISWAAVGPSQSRTLTPTRVGFGMSTWGGTSQHVFSVLYVRFGNG